MDPYKVLGVSPSASDDEVKAAYRSLAKKYHPDAYANNPLADLAAEKMKEINLAYDEITKSRKGGGGGYTDQGSGGYGGYGASQSSYGYSTSGFKQVRDLLNAGRTGDAKSALESVPAGSRNAEWHYLHGHVLYKVGWTNEAYLEFQNAVQMDSSNAEYREAFERVRGQMNGGFYRNTPYGGGYGGQNPQAGGCTTCDLCAGLACADCLCGGLGGC